MGTRQYDRRTIAKLAVLADCDPRLILKILEGAPPPARLFAPRVRAEKVVAAFLGSPTQEDSES